MKEFLEIVKILAIVGFLFGFALVCDSAYSLYKEKTQLEIEKLKYELIIYKEQEK